MAFFTSLYSGSSGNCSVVRCEGKYLLIDMGKSCRTTLNALKEMGLAVADMQGILITHEHSDHIQGLRVFLKHYNVPVYGCSATLDNLLDMELVPPAAELIAIEGRPEEIGGFVVEAFPTSHDVPCCGYRIHTPDGGVMAIATDLGVLTPQVHQALAGVKLAALESNYDRNCLMMGSYPYHLKRRIQSDRGHLDNAECAAKVLELLQDGCEKIALCHLSRENNTPELALATVREAILCAGLKPGENVVIQAQKRNEPSDWMEF